MLDGGAAGLAAANSDDFLSFFTCLLIVECDLSAGLAEHLDGGGANAARASGDESDAAYKREIDHGGGIIQIQDSLIFRAKPLA